MSITQSPTLYSVLYTLGADCPTVTVLFVFVALTTPFLSILKPSPIITVPFAVVDAAGRLDGSTIITFPSISFKSFPILRMYIGDSLHL